MGGAIFYDLYRPVLDNNTFAHNSALYGPDIASYPVKIKLANSDSDEMVFTNVASGQTITPGIELSLVDFDDQIISTDYSSKITMSRIDSNTSIFGTTEVVVKGGIATFSDIALISKPSSENVAFKVSSPALDSQIINLSGKRSLNQINIIASFRI